MPEILTVRSPFDRHLIREFPLAGEKEAASIIEKARAIARDPSQHLPKYQRIAILEKLAASMESQIEELTNIAAEEGGKPYKDSKVEVLRAINGIKIAIAELFHLKGEEIPMGMTSASVGRLAFTTREPIGVVLAISAFNHPLNLIVHQVIPAVAAGCPVIVKPASTTPVSCFNLVRLLRESGLPEDYCIPVVCNRTLAEKIAADPRISYVTFIGSHEVGWKLRRIIAPGTRIALEHGGVAPVIVDKSVNSDEIVPLIAKGAFYHAGQVCVSVQKVFVQERIAEEIAAKLAKEADAMIVGDPLDPQTDIGPLITENEVKRVSEWVEEAKNEGASVIAGGTVLSQNNLLQSYRPTVLYNPSEYSRVSREEIFGPVVCVYPFSEISEAINQANSLRYAFQAAVFSKDIDEAMKAVREINASTIMINDHTAFRVDWMPFGGRDESGIGTGGIPYAMREMTQEKLIVFKS